MIQVPDCKSPIAWLSKSPVLLWQEIKLSPKFEKAQLSAAFRYQDCLCCGLYDIYDFTVIF